MGGRPLGAVVSQLIVAGTSLVLSLIALRQLGASGLGAFSLLLAILITINSIQTGWIGDSLTVLDRFDAGMRRALFQSQWGAAAIIAAVSFVLGLQVDGIAVSTAGLFAVACVLWSLEETLRRILIARREFWSLVVNDSSFAVGALAMIAIVAAAGGTITLETMVIALIAGAIVAIGCALIQLPRIELIRGPSAPSRLRELASFAGWRAVQVGLRPATIALVRAVVATTASLAALGELEAARLLVAPVLTIVNGAGVYLLPTYAEQVKRRTGFNPSVGRAMLVVGGLAVGYGVVALGFREQIVQLLTAGDTPVSTTAVVSWIAFAAAFGLGIPAGSAMVALGRSRRTFAIRAIDAGVGITAATVLALAGALDAVPAGLAAGALLGAGLLLWSLRSDATRTRPVDESGGASHPDDPDSTTIPPRPAPVPAHWQWSAPAREEPRRPADRPPPPPHSTRRSESAPTVRTAARAPTTGRTPTTARPPSTARARSPIDWPRELLWIAPLILIVFTEYKIRRRSIDDVLDGSIDAMIAAELIAYAVVGVWAVWRLIHTPARVEPLVVLMWAYILTTAVSALYSQFPMLATARAVQLIIIGAVVQLISAEADLRTIGRLLHGWLVLLSVSIVAGVAYVAPTTGPQQGRFTWLSVHSVVAGSMLAISVPILFGLWLTARRRPMPWPAWTYGMLLVIHAIFLLATRTRGSIGGAIGAVVLMAWLASGRKARPELVLGSLVTGAALALAFGRPVLEFLTRGETADQIGTFNRRTEIWSLAWDSFLERPIFGLGFNSAKGVFFDETGLGGAHNAAINVMIDVGLAGLLWWSALIVAAIVTLVRLRRRERRSIVVLDGATGTARSDHLILTGVFTSMLINSITTEGLGAGVNVAAMWLLLAAAWLTVLARDERRVRSARQRELAGEMRDRQLEALA